MSRLFPHSAYAEDQPFPKTILTSHVVYRGAQSGAVVGSAIALSRYAYRAVRSNPSVLVPRSSLATQLLRTSGRATVVGAGLSAIAVAARMWGREEIEWADRSWRLLENKGQLEVDDFGLVGTAAGTAVAALARGSRLGWRGVVGRMAMGNLAGVAGYMVYRHGIKGGKWDELQVEEKILS